MPGQTLFLATYSNPDFKPWGTPGATDIAVFVDVLDPSGQPAVPRKVADTAGKVAFHSTAGGEYKMCFSTNGTKWGGDLQKFVRAPPPPPPPRPASSPPPTLESAARTASPPAPARPPTHTLRQRVDLKLDVGESGLDYAEVAKKEHLTELELEIRKLNDKVKDVLNEQSYQKQRELEFRRTSEQIHSKQRYWSIFEVIVMVLATYFQVTTLRSFFRSKKLA